MNNIKTKKKKILSTRLLKKGKNLYFISKKKIKNIFSISDKNKKKKKKQYKKIINSTRRLNVLKKVNKNFSKKIMNFI